MERGCIRLNIITPITLSRSYGHIIVFSKTILCLNAR